MISAYRAIAVVCAVATLALAEPKSGGAAQTGAFAHLPALTLWAWERPEDLRSLPDDVAVAFLAQTLVVHGSEIVWEPRRHPLRVRPTTPLIAVTRIEIPPGSIALDDSALDFLMQALLRTATLPRVAGIQIDFDATASQRVFYRELIARTRGKLSQRTALSITALASWCMDDEWLTGLPIDEAVPMLFRMGPGWPAGRRSYAAARVRSGACGGAVGLSLDEPLDAPARGRRVYFFNPRPWTPRSVSAARRVSR